MRTSWNRMVRSVILVIGVAATGSGCDMIIHSGAPPQNPGYYYPAAASQYRPRLGITELKMDVDPSLAGANPGLGEIAADQLADYLKKSNRFEIIDRAAFSAALQEQHLADIVQPGALVRAANVKGVDYVLVGSIANLNIDKKLQSSGAFRKVTNFFEGSTENQQVVAHAVCDVGFSIVDLGTGDILISNNSEFDATRNAIEMGVDAAPATQPVAATTQPSPADVAAQYPATEKDRQQIIKLALDDAVKKSLPKIDRFLQSQTSPGAAAVNPLASPVAANASPTTAPSAPSGTVDAGHPANPLAAPSPAAAKKICDVCGAENDPSAKFCKKCGSKLP